jgi:DNA invertase Pin-like site-specific DNA recombinase
MVQAAAIYARISSDPEGDQLGVTRQVADCREQAQRRGWHVAETYIDDDRSAYSGKARPEYRRMLADISAGSVDAVVVWHLDRLHRQPRELEEFFDVCKAARMTQMASVSGEVDLSSGDGQFMARILGAVAAKESDDKSRRIKRKALELAMAGKTSGGGTRPFGYLSDRRTIEPAEAAALRGAVARVLAGDSLRAIARDFNTAGITTPTGGPWSNQTLRRTLMSARISGQREYHGEIVAVGEWAPIITPEETTRLRARLNDPERLTRRTVRRYLLSGGLLRCGLCDAVLTARPTERGDRRYVCSKGPGQPGCGRIGVLADPLEALIAEAVLYRLDTPELAAALAGAVATNADAAATGDALALDQAQLTELATAYGERQITLAEMLAARAPIEARIDAAKRRLSRITHTTAIEPWVGASSALRATWADLPLNSQRSIVAAVLAHAVVRPAVPGRTRFDPDRVEPLWRV